MNTAKIGEDQPTLNHGSAQLQTVIGLLFAGAGVFFIAVLAARDFDALANGTRPLEQGAAARK